ncbi:MAG: hypothetical protein HQ461_10620, partial [Deltaproteobacteria bacterium]|nr:hypothetical protein [Deltaproteobacteria bacterium]
MRAPIATSLLLFALAACGRTTAQAVVADGDATDAQTSDAASDSNEAAADADAAPADADTDEATADTRPAAPAPRFVLVATPDCPIMGSAEALALSAPEQALVLVQTKVSDECSGAGGEYFIGAEQGGGGDLWLGGHACYFLDPLLRTPSDRIWWGLARVVQTAGLRETPTGWCITSLSGAEPVRSDSSV